MKVQRVVVCYALVAAGILVLLEGLLPGLLFGRCFRVGRNAESMHEYGVAQAMARLVLAQHEIQGEWPRGTADVTNALGDPSTPDVIRNEMLRAFVLTNIDLNSRRIVARGTVRDEQGFVFAVSDRGEVLKVRATDVPGR